MSSVRSEGAVNFSCCFGDLNIQTIVIRPQLNNHIVADKNSQRTVALARRLLPRFAGIETIKEFIAVELILGC
jgi:hypothetical protein